jgi:RES domain-containing protein
VWRGRILASAGWRIFSTLSNTGSRFKPVPLRLWRIVTSTQYPIWSGEGARLYGARWNPKGSPAIYAGTTFAISLLEVLVHANRGSPPSAARFVEAVVPDDVSREWFDPSLAPGWDHPDDRSVAQAFGGEWIDSGRSALLIVPSVVTAARDENAVVNPDHPDAARIDVGPEMPVVLDRRLFGR